MCNDLEWCKVPVTTTFNGNVIAMIRSQQKTHGPFTNTASGLGDGINGWWWGGGCKVKDSCMQKAQLACPFGCK